MTKKELETLEALVLDMKDADCENIYEMATLLHYYIDVISKMIAENTN